MIRVDRNDKRVVDKIAALQQISDRVRNSESNQVEAYAFTLILRDQLQELGWNTSLLSDGFTVVLTEREEE